MSGLWAEILSTLVLILGGTASAGGLVVLVADAGAEGTRSWSVLGQQVQSTLVGVGALMTGAAMMAASVLVSAGSGGMLSGSSAIAAAGDYWPETEPNDDWRGAQPLPGGETLIGIAEPGDRDRFAVRADPGGPDLAWEFRALPDAGRCRLSLRRQGTPVRALAAAVPADPPRRGRARAGPGAEVGFGVESAGDGICRYLLTVTVGG